MLACCEGLEKPPQILGKFFQTRKQAFNSFSVAYFFFFGFFALAADGAGSGAAAASG